MQSACGCAIWGVKTGGYEEKVCLCCACGCVTLDATIGED